MKRAAPPRRSEPGCADASRPVLDELMRAREQGRKAELACAFIYAHPDDESVGSSVLLGLPGDCAFLSATDGAPRDGADATARGFPSWREYAAKRKSEWLQALSLAGAGTGSVLMLDFADQQATLHLKVLAYRILEFLDRIRPDAVITHPYEGGHPDHDAVSFCVRAACHLLAREGAGIPALLESAFYHAGPAVTRHLQFLPGGRAAEETGGDDAVRTVALTPEERAFKARLFSCYESQKGTLSWFPQDVERFRPAPRIDFSQPPHDGPLFYEGFSWGMNGARFRRFVEAAAGGLGVDVVL